MTESTDDQISEELELERAEGTPIPPEGATITSAEIKTSLDVKTELRKSPPPKTGEPRSSFELIADYCKAMITLGSALLAITVTLSVNVIGKLERIQAIALFSSWLFLALTILFCVLSLARLTNFLYVGDQRHEDGCIRNANISWITLVLAVMAFLTLGGSALLKGASLTTTAVVAKALVEMPRISGKPDSTWTLQSVKQNELSKSFQLVVVEEKTSAKFLLFVDAAKGDIVAAERQ